MTALIRFYVSSDRMKRWLFSLDIPIDNIGIYGEKFDVEKNSRREFPI